MDLRHRVGGQVRCGALAAMKVRGFGISQMVYMINLCPEAR